MLTTLDPAVGEVLVTTTWDTRQAIAQRLLDTARRVGVDIRSVRRGRGGYIVPVAVARALGEPARRATRVEAPPPPAKQTPTPVEALAGKPQPEQPQRTHREIIRDAFTADPSLMTLTAREVARRLGVDHSMVGKVRKAIQRGEPAHA